MWSSFFLKEVVLLLVIVLTNVAGSDSNLLTDHDALMKIKSMITNDPHDVLRSWNDSLPFCMWQGVTCGRRHQRVTSLNITSKGVEGSLSPFIGNLSFLRSIILDDNLFYGSIPHEISNLSRLQMLSLSKNNFSGEIPANISSCSKLWSINLISNKLYGKIPNIFSSLQMMKMLRLSNNNFTGGIPPSIGNLTYLQILYLSNNPLGGSIPNSFNRLKKLRELVLTSNGLIGVFPWFSYNLSLLEVLCIPDNQLRGNLPTNLCLSQPHLQGGIKIDFGKLQQLYFLGLFGINFESNPVEFKNLFDSLSNCSNLKDLVLSESRLVGVLPNSIGNFSSKMNYFGLDGNYVSGTLPSSIGLGLVSFFLFYFCVKKDIHKTLNTTSTKSFEKISYGELFKATEGFSPNNLIGTGSFASVYKGVLDENGFTVAVKVLNLNRRGGLRSFIAECDALRNIRHRNLVKVITSCSSIDFQGNDFKALVYDFMPNGSLESWMHSTHQMLDLAQRINIVKDVACALDYLHCRCENVVVHCDLKPSNILLDADMVAHVGDFGLAKILSLEGVSNTNNNSSSVFRGTIGYAPPEYGLGSEVSMSGDIYSYGILLLEMMTGKRPVDPMFEEGLTLHFYARNALADETVLQILDPVLLDEDVDEKSLISLVRIGVQCSSKSPQDRMDIETVVHELFSIKVAAKS